MKLRKSLQIFGLFLLLLCLSSPVLSDGACTYREALMAMERGNIVRGMALMNMAQRDGDERASRYLVNRGVNFVRTFARPDRSDKSLISLNQMIPE